MLGISTAAIGSFFVSVPAWAWFVFIVSGIGGGLYISNKWAEARLTRHRR